MSEASDALRAAMDDVVACGDVPVAQAKERFAEAMKRVIALRNRQITGGAGLGADDLRALNALLSLMASIEFPLAGFHRERLEQVEAELRRLLERQRS